MKLTESKTSFLLALSLLTCIPVGAAAEVNDKESGRSALFYPLIGLMIGAIVYLPILLFPNAPAHVLAAIIMALWASITGGLHLDGLADSADGWLGGLGDPERTLRIMKDPVVGAAGAIVLGCFLLLKFVSITALIEDDVAWLIIVAPPLGRSMILLTFRTTPYVNMQGMANSVVEHLPKKTSWAVLMVGVVGSFYASFWGGLLVLVGFYLLRRLMLKRLAGCTGDTVGATVEISEMLLMLGAVLAG